MTLRTSIAVIALTATLAGFPSRADAQVTVSPGGVTIGHGSTGMFIPYGGGGVQFSNPAVGTWNYSNGTLSPAYSSYYTPYGNYAYGNNFYSPYSYGSMPYTGYNTAYSSYYVPSNAWGTTYSDYSSFYTPNTTSWSGWTSPSAGYYSSYYYPTWGSNYYVTPSRVRMFRR
jgi:hypothetical protein